MLSSNNWEWNHLSCDLFIYFCLPLFSLILILDYVFINFLFSLFPKQQQVVGCLKTQLLAQQTQLLHTDQITQLLMMWTPLKTPLKKTLLKKTIQHLREKTTQHQGIQLWILMTSTLLKMLIIAMETHLILKVIIKDGTIFIVIHGTGKTKQKTISVFALDY